MNLLKTRFAIDDLILEMTRTPPQQLRLSHLYDWVSQLDLKDDLFQQHLCFCSQGYQRRLLCRTSRFEMLILCWQPGQSSTIHDHADSLNVTRVYQGILTSRTFQQSCGTGRCRFQQVSEKQLHRNELATVDRHEIHQLANLSDHNLVTLHVYARPLQTIQVYCPQSGAVEQVPVRFALDQEFAER